jgi:hypothetical protein
VDPVPDPLLLRKCDSARNQTQTSGSIAGNRNRGLRENDITATIFYSFYMHLKSAYYIHCACLSFNFSGCIKQSSPTGWILVTSLYSTADVPLTEKTLMATFADDTTIMSLEKKKL